MTDLLDSTSYSDDVELLSLDEYIPKFRTKVELIYLPKLLNYIANFGSLNKDKVNPLEIILTTPLPKVKYLKNIEYSFVPVDTNLYSLDIDYLFDKLIKKVSNKEKSILHESMNSITLDDITMRLLKRHYMYNSGITLITSNGEKVNDRTGYGEYYQVAVPIMKIAKNYLNELELSTPSLNNLFQYITFIRRKYKGMDLDEYFNQSGTFNGLDMELFRYYLCYIYISYVSTNGKLSNDTIHNRVPKLMSKFFPGSCKSIIDIVTYKEYTFYYSKLKGDDEPDINIIYDVLKLIGTRTDALFNTSIYKYVSDDGFILDDLINMSIDESFDIVEQIVEYVRTNIRD